MQTTNGLMASAVNSTSAQPMMEAIAQTEYGGPEVLESVKMPRPVPNDHDILVRGHAASVNAGDWHLMRGVRF